MADKVKDKGFIRMLVYGTLKEEHGNHGLLEEANARFMGYDSITGAFRMCDMRGFPGIYRGKAKDPLQTIYGELYCMEPEGLAAIDLLEGHPSFYRREKYLTNGNANTDQKRAWVYFLSPPVVTKWAHITAPENQIPEGIWRPTKEENTYWEKVAA